MLAFAYLLWTPYWPASIAGCLGLIAYGRLAVQGHAERVETDRRDRALLEGFGGHPCWIVQLLVHHGDAPVGSDRGVLWIEDERLYFAGNRTSFGLSADQAAGFCRNDAKIPHLKNSLELRLRHATLAGPVGISFSPVGTAGDSAGRLHVPILCAVNHWIGRSTSTGGQLPPLSLGPDAESAARLFGRAAAAVVYWAAIPSILVLGWNASPPIAVALAVGGIVGGSVLTPVWSPWLRVRAWRDRRKL